MSSLRKRYVFLVEIECDSPLAVASGENEFTDADVLRDFDGKPFVSGSSLAGSFRAYLEHEKTSKCLMGYLDQDGGKMSSLFVSDLYFNGTVETMIRDSVALDENKITITGAKFDMEVVASKSKGIFFMEYVIREEYEEVLMHQELNQILKGINQGELRLGSKKTRGYGQFHVCSVKERVFNKNNYLEYSKAYDLQSWNGIKNSLEQRLDEEATNKMLHIEVPLQLKGGISIRQYAVKKNEPDFVHINEHGVAIIPGTSIMGAIRARVKQILTELIQSQKMSLNCNVLLDRMFGFVKENDASISSIIAYESKIKHAYPLVMVRTGISRFESSAKNGSLYKEKTYVDGTTIMHFAVCKQEEDCDTEWMVGLLLLALKDLQQGFLSIGGQSAIGRGIFTKNGEITIDHQANEMQWISKVVTNLRRLEENV